MRTQDFALIGRNANGVPQPLDEMMHVEMTEVLIDRRHEMLF
jgi:hypothetical protein